MNDSRKIRFTNSKISDLMYEMTFDPKKKNGSVITNVSIIREEDLKRVLQIFHQISWRGLIISPHIKIFREGENIGGLVVGEGEVGLATVCSTTIDGMLIKSGIPINLKGGGIVEVAQGRALRFTHFLDYRCTTIDPLEILMSQRLTSVMKMIKTGSGRVLANLREVPMVAREDTEETLEKLIIAGFNGVLEVGEPNSDLFGVSVERDHIGIAIVGGTNPSAAIQEDGMDIRTKAMSNLIEFSTMEEMA
ncbi:MAG: DUF128 domain-containing protein [Halobacteriota archaeon]|nr:DUF128 domain-containing protein [Halobacteriota archaeon]